MEKLINQFSSPDYWTQWIQLSLYNYLRNYLESHNMTQKDFAEKLGVSKGYVSQIMKGDFDHKLSKLVELCLACELIPKFEFVPLKYAEKVIKHTYQNPKDWELYGDFFIVKSSVAPSAEENELEGNLVCNLLEAA